MKAQKIIANPMERNIKCTICGQTFSVTGYGSYVRCPYCGANLQIGKGDVLPIRQTQGKLAQQPNGSDGRVTDYYDSDTEGAPDYYGFD